MPNFKKILRKTQRVIAPGRKPGEDRDWHRLRCQLELAEENRLRQANKGFLPQIQSILDVTGVPEALERMKDDADSQSNE